MSRNIKNKILAAAINGGAYGADAIQASAALFMQTTNLDIVPAEGEDVDRAIDSKRGNSPRLVVGSYAKVTGSVEITGAGTAANAPAYAPVVACAGWNGATGGTEYVYSKINTEGKDSTFYVYKDGALHKMTGSRCSMTITFNINQPGYIEFEITGLYQGPTKEGFPNNPDLSAFLDPVEVSAAATTFELGGVEMEMYEFSFAENNEIQYDQGTKAEKVYLTNYAGDGRVLIEAPELDVFDPFAMADGNTITSMKVTHGTAANNIFILNLPEVQLQRPGYAERNGRVAYELNFWAIGGGFTITTK